MKKLALAFILACSCTVYAQKTINGQILDYVTHLEISDAMVTLMTTDSTVVDSTKNKWTCSKKTNCYVFFNIPKEGGKYLLKVEAEGYVPICTTIEIPKFYKREGMRLMPEIILKKKERIHTIDNVVVTATRVKFYNKGDTLVYNADAFQLSEGSMLSELVKQLPGAELKADGRIFVNGRFVESLMLNGKDFFKGNNTVLLENLPTYAVSTIKVYDKAGKLSEFTGKEIIDDKELVMDVGLKKQYRIGWLGNIDAGGANHDLYMARLFAMRFTEHSQLAVYGNINNLNDFTTPQSGSDWTPDKMPYGRLTTKQVGMNLNINDRAKRFTYDGNVDVTNYDNNQTEDIYRQNFLSTGDTYEREQNKSKFDNLFVNNSNHLYLTPGGGDSKVSVDIRQNSRFTRHKSTTRHISATSDETWDGFGDFVKLLSAPILDNSLRDRLINRQIRNSISDNKAWSTDMSVNTSIKVPHCDDLIGIYASGRINGSDHEYFDRNRVDFFSKSSSTVDFRNRFTDATPYRGYDYRLSANYNYFQNEWFHTMLSYSFAQNYIQSQNSLYCLERLEGWNEDTEHELGSLPSREEYLSTLDRTNSFNSLSHYSTHTVTWFAQIKLFDSKKSRMYIMPNVNLDIRKEKLAYIRASVDTAFAKDYVFVTPSIGMKWNTHDWKETARFDYKMSTSTPQMLYFVDFVDDSDPMSTVNYGNRKLKNSQSHKFSLSYNNDRKSVKFAPFMNFNIHRNLVSTGYIYDESTGRREYSHYNVNGNWNFGTGININGYVDKKKNLTFTNNTSWNYHNSVDMIGTTATEVPLKSTVKTSNLSETFNMTYSLKGSHSIGLKGTLAWLHATGDRDDFTTINAYSYNYGVWGFFNLPWKLQLNTDFTVYSRRGYDEPSMNDDNFVWNARITRPFFKGRMLLRIDMFDILHQLRKVEYAVNTQGRTERYFNTPPRYVLAHVIYKFNIAPKKKM